ncbi:MAG: phosphodiester glycosidase family protein [Cyanobacteriota bacterium]|nr:phosphodiester glycosidase family protein [Cyanobacteriota bacterium]
MTRSKGNRVFFWKKYGKRLGLALIFFLLGALLSSRFSLAKTRNSQGETAAELQNTRSRPVLVAREEPAPKAVPVGEQPPTAQTPTLPPQPPTLVAASPQVRSQGSQISLNGKTYPVPWLRWQEGNTEHFGISDTAAERLGIELLNSTTPNQQPVRWFSEGSPIILKTLFRNPYRYLDLSNLTAAGNLQLSVAGETLVLISQPARIVNVRQGQQTWGERFVVDLDRPTFWQETEGREEASVTLDGTADSALIQRLTQAQSGGIGSLLSRILPQADSKNGKNTGSLGRIAESTSPETKTLPFKIETSGSQTTLRFKLPEDKGLKVTTLPNRLVIDVTSEPFSDREIFWQPGVIWKQQQISVGNVRFPVTSLELNPRSGIGLRPIWGNLEGMTGIEPLVKMGRAWEAVAAINGGFFNRNTKQPLGVIRRDQRWFSGPILNRGAIAWNDSGNIKIDRLRLEETAVTSTGQRIPVIYLNSGYVQRGVSRYTSEWGSTYTPLTDDETLALVQNNIVTYQYPGGENGKMSFPIPPDGYLLTIRANSISPNTLAVGTQVSMESQTFPADFANYPQIMGAGPLLLKNRQIVLNAADEKFSAAFNQQSAPRSIIATRSSGTILLATVHNPPNRRGPTLAELAQLVQRLGAVDALNLDGGSSTSLYLGGHLIDRDPTTAARVHNGIGVYLPQAR